ncbi:NAD(P)/FAD-dependent oxidoreductase [Peribacillus asahii]|uniref:NAD(P)/FAD-dependent oxidoreductase n=1 Tax=Peribacillus asahii TaxID=228899 RepID=UPI00381C1501
MKHIDVIIIGGGPAGMSAAIWCKRLGIDHLLLEKEEKLGGQLTKIHNEIIDYPGLYAKNGKEMQREFAAYFHKAGCLYRLHTKILSIDVSAKTLKIQQENKIEELHFHYLVLAMGSGPKLLEVSGEREMIARGEVYSATVDRWRFKNKVVAVVGGGDRALEGAVLLANADATVYLIHRSENFKARSQYMDILTKEKNIKVITNTQVTAIHGKRCVTSIDLLNNQGEDSTLEVDAVLLRIGSKPNSELVKGLVKVAEDGLVVTDRIGQTSNSAIYAIGDICTNPLFSSIASSNGQAAIVAKYLSLLLTKKHLD